jgi:type I restriction enzyme, S subunit
MEISETCRLCELPEGWVWSKVGHICEHPQYGWTTSAKNGGGGLKLLRTTDISSGQIDWGEVPFCKDEPGNAQNYLLSSGDILISRAGSVGINCLIRDCPEAIFASYLIRLRPIKPISSEYLHFFLNSPDYWSAISDHTAGITIPNVNASKLSDISIPIPPLVEQDRIVSKVDELLAGVNAARERLARVPGILKQFRQSVLAAACSGRLTTDWREKYSSFESPEKLLERIFKSRLSEYDNLYRMAEQTGKKNQGNHQI